MTKLIERLTFSVAVYVAVGSPSSQRIRWLKRVGDAALERALRDDAIEFDPQAHQCLGHLGANTADKSLCS